jgi:hypothetical protein
VPGVFVDTPPGCGALVSVTAMTWSSDLSLDGRLQIVLGGAVSFAGRGRAYGTSARAGNESRVEATVVEAAGRPGQWRFDLIGADAGGSARIHVIAGDVVAVTGGSVIFRLQGKAGERVAFTIARP